MINYDEFSKVDLRVAEILDVKDHPNADKLYVLQIKVGGEEKQIVAGIRKHYDKDELVGKKIIIVNNLEPVKLRGEESNGMLLAASDEDSVVLLTLDKDIESGSKIK